MDLEVDSGKFRNKYVLGEVNFGEFSYRVKATDYGSSFHLKITDRNGNNYSDTHTYRDIENFESSERSLEELFELAMKNTEEWVSDSDILFIGERRPDKIRY